MLLCGGCGHKIESGSASAPAGGAAGDGATVKAYCCARCWYGSRALEHAAAAAAADNIIDSFLFIAA